MSQTPHAPARSQGRPGLALAVTGAALFMVVLDNLGVTTALPSIRTDLGASVEQLGWFVNAYTLTFAVLLLPGAALGDRFGRRRVFELGLALFTVASAAAALAPGSGELVAARAFQGLGASGIMAVNSALLRLLFPPHRLGRGVGLNALVVGIGFAVPAKTEVGSRSAPITATS